MVWELLHRCLRSAVKLCNSNLQSIASRPVHGADRAGTRLNSRTKGSFTIRDLAPSVWRTTNAATKRRAYLEVSNGEVVKKNAQFFWAELKKGADYRAAVVATA